jgi:phytol kinase
MLQSVWLAFVITLIVAVIWLRVIEFFAHRRIIGSRFSRKIIHIGTGPIFVLCWLLFPDQLMARYLAAIVPLLITIKFFLVGIGFIKDQSSVEAMSRSNDRRDILKGPIYYGIVFVVLTILFWKDTVVGIIGLMLMCGGDGLAEMVGTRIKSMSLPWAKGKTIAGSLAMFFGGWSFSFIVLWIYSFLNVLPISISKLILPLCIISFACMLIESLPLDDIDNITVPITAVFLGYLLY